MLREPGGTAREVAGFRKLGLVSEETWVFELGHLLLAKVGGMT